jgi:NADH-ubiquinone oxidoreductase chain 6
MGVNLIIYPSLKLILVSLAFIAGIFVIGTKNAIISVFNLIVLYILVAFYLIYMGITYLGISYIIVYIGAIAILFLFVIMMIDVEIVEKKSNNYLPLLFLLLGGFIISLKKILYNIGVIKIKSLSYEKQDNFLIDCANERLFNRIFQSDIEEDKVISKGRGIENIFEEFSNEKSHEENNKEYDSSLFDDINSKEDNLAVFDENDNGFNLDVNELLENVNLIIEDNLLNIEKLPMPDLSDLIGISAYHQNNYLLILPD